MSEPYIIEFTVIGNSVRVSALDPTTLKEVSIVAPAHYPQEYLAKQVAKKLERALKAE